MTIKTPNSKNRPWFTLLRAYPTPLGEYWLKFLRNNSNQSVLRKPSVDFSLTGVIYCSMMLFMGLAAVNTQANLLFGVFGLMIGVLLVSMVLCRLVLSRLRVQRVLPEHGVVGQPMTIQYHFYNAKRFWPSLSVTISELDGAQAFRRQPSAYMLHAAARMTAVVPSELIAQRRGLYRLGSYQISTSFPFGFIKRAFMGRKEDKILIYPALGEVSPRLLALCRSAERSGANRKPRRGGSDEFYGVKEFREGENPRYIYWKRSARAGELVVREMAQISPPRLVILVDTYTADSSIAESAEVERSIARAASLARVAQSSGMSVGLCAWAGDWEVIPPRRGKQQSRDLLAALASLPTNHTGTLQQMIEKSVSLARNEVTMVLFTPQRVQLGLADQVRGTMLVVSGDSEQANAWFKFHRDIDFSRCIPEGQIPYAAQQPAEIATNFAAEIATAG
jgi:uncharacterized protein (DUF58 family)